MTAIMVLIIAACAALVVSAVVLFVAVCASRRE
jgi:hypothetical protein